LAQFGLPTDNVIASTDERSIVAANLAAFLSAIPAAEKREARYLSKFVGATAIGLFDAALNYVWNEVVLSLRKKAAVYGVDLFFDAAIGVKNRELYKDENDLGGLKDSVLLNTCQKLELISDIVYRKLEHILTMRNEVAASHPNVVSIGGYELLGWLQTCVKDVLQDRPSESAIRIRALIDNLKASTDVIEDSTLGRLTSELKNLSISHVNNLAISLFGIFVTPETHQILKKNISRIAPPVWNHAEDRVKYRIGVMIDGYRTNLRHDRLAAGLDFLKLVDGRSYEALPAKTVALEHLCDQLEDAHEGWDNFYHEPPIAQEILSYFKSSVDIPKACLPKLVRIFLRCRLGRGLSYRDGVSPSGMPMFDRFFALLDDAGVAHCIVAFFNPEINSKLQNPTCQKHLTNILQTLRKIAISDRLKSALDLLVQNPGEAYKMNRNVDFRELTKAHISWK
jgi:hypothetical protein